MKSSDPLFVRLGLPRFLGGLILKGPQIITVMTIGLVVIPIAILLAIIIALVAILLMRKWKLSQPLGYILFAMYGASFFIRCYPSMEGIGGTLG